MFRRYPILLSTITLLCSVEFLQTGMIAFAAAPIRGEIEASPEEYSLIAALYACVAVISIAKQRWMTERYGWRRYLLASMVVFAMGSTVCGLSQSVAGFAVGRVIMALGGGAFMTSARVMVQMIPAGPGRFSGVKAFAIGLAGGTSLAPVTASLMVAYSTWEGIFWLLNALILIVGIIAYPLLPNQPHPEQDRSHSSLARVLLLGLSSFLLLYLLQRSYYDFYNETGIMLVFVLLAAVALASFILMEHQHHRPLLNLKGIANRRYAYGIALYCFAYLMLGANNYVLPTFLQSALGFSWETVGHYQSIGLAGTLVTWLVMSEVIPRFPRPKKFFIAGFLSLMGFSALLSLITPAADMATHIVPALFFNGCFIMFLLATAATQTFKDVGHDDRLFTNAQQLKNMAGQVATATGTAIATLFMQWRSTVQYDALNIRLVQGDDVYQHYVSTLASWLSRSYEAATASKIALAEVASTISQQSTFAASIEYFSVVCLIGIAALAYSLWQKIFD